MGLRVREEDLVIEVQCRWRRCKSWSPHDGTTECPTVGADAEEAEWQELSSGALGEPVTPGTRSRSVHEPTTRRCEKRGSQSELGATGGLNPHDNPPVPQLTLLFPAVASGGERDLRRDIVIR